MTHVSSLPILVVDDYQTMVKILRSMLGELGFKDIDTASDGQEALAKLREKRYGLVISDWNMEPMSGLDLLRHVRAENAGDVRFIMVTAESKTDHVIAARRAGVDTYIVKPFNAATLKKKIDAALAA
jgi:two-component system chemotaxis response regulator CheY